ncbi:MAG: TrkA C-terminal domain-containing protein, partial [Actinomycetota bacterium]
VERTFPDRLVGEKVLELELREARLSALRRLGAAVIPDHKTMVQQGDVGYFTVQKDSLATLDKFLAEGKS